MLPEEERIKNDLSINEDGWCTKLTEDNQCSIYKDRPEVCRVSKEYELTAAICNIWMDEDKSEYPRVEYAEEEDEATDN